MAHKKTTMLDALVTQLQALSEVTKATRVLLLPSEARKHAPYVGLISGSEEVVVEDSTHVRYELDLDFLLLKSGRDIESMLDAVKLLLFNSATATAIGALQIRIIGQEEVALVDADKFSSTHIVATVTYVAEKDVF
jgi:hypothetical protein